MEPAVDDAGYADILHEAVRIKAEILAHGVNLTPELLRNFGPPYLEKRRAYGNQDPPELRRHTIPQEVWFADRQVIAAVNVRPSSPWDLTFDGTSYRLFHSDGRSLDVDFPRRPGFYDRWLPGGRPTNQIVTLYGGTSLAVFVYGSCSLVETGNPCGYCSIEQNRSIATEYDKVVRPAQLRDALASALSDSPDHVNQVMLNGGNFHDADKSFQYYAELVSVAREAIDRSGKLVELHLIVFPPKDLSLFERLRGTGASIAMNTEIYDPQLFARYCPGKAKVIDRCHMFDALEAASDVVGRGHVFSIFVGGLEPLDSLREGLDFVFSKGAVPVINVFHPDPGTPLESHPAPPVEQIMAMGRALQGAYDQHEFARPFYDHCGRNSLDSEAHMRLFV